MADAPGDSTGVDLGRIGRRVALFALVAVAAVVALATLPGIGEVRDRLGRAEPGWIVVSALCSLGSSLGFVAALWGAFDRVPPRSSAVTLGFAEQGANVLLPGRRLVGPRVRDLRDAPRGRAGRSRRGPPRRAVLDHQRGEPRRARRLRGAARHRHPPGRGVAGLDADPRRRGRGRDRARGAVRAHAPAGRAPGRAARAARALAAALVPAPRRAGEHRRAAPRRRACCRSAPSPTTRSTSPRSGRRSRPSAAAGRRSACSCSPTRSATPAP